MKNDKRLNIDGLCYYERREEKIQSSDEKERKRNELVGNEDLFQFILLFGEFQSSLNAVTIRCFPHVIIFDNSFQTLPRQLETKARISFSLSLCWSSLDLTCSLWISPKSFPHLSMASSKELASAADQSSI